jgi:hypothetical protein
MANTSHTQVNIEIHSLTSTPTVQTLSTIYIGTEPEHRGWLSLCEGVVEL